MTNDIPKPQAATLLETYGISHAGIGRTLGLTSQAVTRALAPDRFMGCEFKTVFRVRELCGRLIKAAGWGGDVRALWREYDTQLSQKEKEAA